MTKLADIYYDSDDPFPNRSPQLKPRRVKLEPPPPPKSHVTVSVHPPTVRPPSQMDSVLLSFMDPNQPEVGRAARDNPLDAILDPAGPESDMDGPNGISPIAGCKGVRASEGGSEDATVPEVDMDGPNGISPRAGREDARESKSSSEDLVNTAQNALHTMVGHLTGVSLDQYMVGHSPRKPGAPKEADGVGNVNGQETHIEPDRGNDPSSQARNTEGTGVDSDFRVSGDAADALVRLKERSPKRSQSQARTQVEGHIHDKDNLGAMPAISARPKGPALTTEEPPPHTLPTISSSRSPARQLETPLLQTDKPNLPPLRSHLNQLAEVAEKESIQSLDGRNGAGRPHQGHLVALSAAHARSPPSPSVGPAQRDLPRPPVQYMTIQQRQHFIPVESTKGAYAPPNRLSPVSSHDETSPQDPFRRNGEVTGTSPTPEPGHASSYPYYYNRRPSHASETPYPTPPKVDGGTVGEGLHRSPRQVLQDHQVDVDRIPQPSQKQPNGHTKGGSHQCPYPGCTAPPFQTQYLLNSHANVHSQARPHFCPVKDCPRGVGGRGFKRKNEMIRHGLVHASPGYVCPFCPEKEHRYPRPDNLQRHVRVHHIDKHKDDPALRDVLSQRPEGGNRGRRRRSGH